jgi:hypothetical protein
MFTGLSVFFTGCSDNDDTYYYQYDLSVVDKNDIAIPNAYIHLKYVHYLETGSDTIIISHAKTDSTGTISYTNLYAGQYKAVYVDSLNNMKEDILLFDLTNEKDCSKKGVLVIDK